jgi:type IV pilus assembly protein PilY1
VDLDYNVDVMYIGENYKQGGNWNGLMKRITTNEGLQPLASSWVMSNLGNVNSIAGNKDAVKRITSAPSAAMDDKSNLWVFFGTGQFYGLLDKNNNDTGGFYALRDACWDGSCTATYSNVMDISGASVKTDGTVAGVSGSCGSGSTSWTSLLTSSGSCDGWSMYFGSLGENVDFSGETLSHAGERMLSKPTVLGGLVTFATYIPGIDECAFEGESNIYAVYYKTGTSHKKYVFHEQKSDPNPSDVVGRVKKLGPGMPSSVSVQVTSSGSAKGFVQSQNGSILSIETDSPFSLRSGLKGWMSDRVQ